MRLSFIFELLLIFVLIAFAASRVIDESKIHGRAAALRNHQHHHHNSKLAGQKLRQEASTAANKYCTCNTKLCNCCREFQIPVVALQGPGCASLQYLRGDKLAISMSFGDRILTNTTIDSRKPKPVCMPLPGGVSKFCGRVYNIARQGEDFNACLGLELRAVKDVEAALRVSCFKFGPKGLKLAESQPLPAIETSSSNNNEEDDDDDDYDDEDDFDFDDVDDLDDVDDDDDDDEDDDGDDEDNTVDYTAFSVLDDDFIGTLFASESGGGGGNKRRKVVSTTKAPLRRTPTRRTVQRKPLVTATTPAVTKKVPTQGQTVLQTQTQAQTQALSQTLQTTTEKQVPKRKTTVVRRKTNAPSSATISSSTKPTPIVENPEKNKVVTVSSTSKPTEATKAVPLVSSTTTKKPSKITRATARSTTTKPSSPSTTTTTTTTTPLPETISTTTTTESVGIVTSATIVTSEKKPEQPLPDKPIASNEVIATPHESIAAVAAMLQNIPGESATSQEAIEASKVAPAPSTEKANIVTLNYVPLQTINKVESTSTIQNEVSNEVTNPELAESTTFGGPVTEAESEPTTPNIADEEEDEEDTVTLQNFIIKNEEEENSGYSTTDATVMPTDAPTTEQITTTQSVEKPKDKIPAASSKVEKIIKPESKDVFTDIIDGVVSTFTGESDEDKDGKKPAGDDKDDDDDDDDDDDFLGDDDDDDDDDDEDDEKEDDEKENEKENEDKEDEKLEDEEDDDEEDDDEKEEVQEPEKESHIEHDEDEDDDDDDDDFAGRKAKQHQKIQTNGKRAVRGRQSRDMWLDRLHW